MNITIIGTGFVGVVSSAVYASFGHSVTGLDIDPAKVASLTKGQVPFYEPNLESLLLEQQAKGNLRFTTEYAEAIASADVIIIAVGTPSAADGQADLKYVWASAKSLAPHLKKDAIVVIKSTVPPGTLDKLTEILGEHATVPFEVASLPEFLREGSAVHDTLHPDRIIIGAASRRVFSVLEQLHKPLNAPIIKISPESAQMAKYAANAYLATRITFINQIADLCEKNNADVQEVVQAMGYDQRIGHHYWYPGFGYGGSCFPKDVKELAAYSRAVGEGNNLFNKITELNEDRIPRLLTHIGEQVGGWQGKTVAILGLAFKPNTDDTREAPALKVVPALLAEGASVRTFDPKATWPAWAPLPADADVSHFTDLKKSCESAHVIIALIEWPTIISFDYSQTRTSDKQQWFVDARNQFEPSRLVAWGYTYLGTGRPSAGEATQGAKP
jgi:UDPglucose 6-dehydrogenase